MIKYLVLPVIALIICCKLNAQKTAGFIDSTLDKMGAKNSRFGKIKTEKPAKRKTFFYHKSNKKMFSIIVRNHWALHQRDNDTMTLTGYFFIENKLIGIRVHWVVNSRMTTEERFYFEDDQVLPYKSGLNSSARYISGMIAKAYELLAEGNFRIEQKFKGP